MSYWSVTSRVSLSQQAHFTLTHSPTSAPLVTRLVLRLPYTKSGCMACILSSRTGPHAQKVPVLRGSLCLEVPGLGLLLCCPCLEFLMIIKQIGSYFHFALSPQMRKAVFHIPSINFYFLTCSAQVEKRNAIYLNSYSKSQYIKSYK